MMGSGYNLNKYLWKFKTKGYVQLWVVGFGLSVFEMWQKRCFVTFVQDGCYLRLCSISSKSGNSSTGRPSIIDLKAVQSDKICSTIMEKLSRTWWDTWPCRDLTQEFDQVLPNIMSTKCIDVLLCPFPYKAANSVYKNKITTLITKNLESNLLETFIYAGELSLR